MCCRSMFQRLQRSLFGSKEAETPAPEPPGDDTPAAPPAGGVRNGCQHKDDDPGFRVMSDEELAAVVGATPDAEEEELPAPPSGSFIPGTCVPPPQPGVSEAAAPTAAEKEEWDARFTFHAEQNHPGGNLELDPVKINEYSILAHLGSGAFGSVKLGERRVGSPPYHKYAIKMLSRMRLRKRRQIQNDGQGGMIIRTAEDMVKSEIAVMRHLFHRHVCLLFEVLDDPANDNIYLVMEYMEGGLSMAYDPDTQRFTSALTGGVLTEPLAAKLFFGLVSGLQYLHGRRIVHRDIKPENLLLTEGTKLRITDFGCAVQFKEGEPAELCDTAGTLSFLGPECCAGSPYDAYGADVWAAAVTLYCYVYGRLPFSKDGLEPLLASIREDPVPYPEDVSLSGELRELMEGLLEKDTARRWALGRARAHVWLEGPRREDREEDEKVKEKRG